MSTDAQMWQAIREANAATELVARGTQSPGALSAMWRWEYDRALARLQDVAR